MATNNGQAAQGVNRVRAHYAHAAGLSGNKPSCWQCELCHNADTYRIIIIKPLLIIWEAAGGGMF
jgi:hypothetical protein